MTSQHFRDPHESYLGKKLEHCPNCSAEVYWTKNEQGYECWVCKKCGEQYLFKLPLEQQRRRKWWLRHETTTTNVTQPKPLSSSTPVTPTTTPKSSDDNTAHHIRWIEKPYSKGQDRPLWTEYIPVTSPPSKSNSQELKDSPTSSPTQGCSECKGKCLTVGSPVTVKLQCPDQIEQRLNKLEARNLLASRLRLDRIAKLENKIEELRETIEPLQRGVKWVSGENLKLKRRVVSLSRTRQRGPP
jgi:DNA-directed RNA polymerase subunit M/transcription elongation factor TFIIS